MFFCNRLGISSSCLLMIGKFSSFQILSNVDSRVEGRHWKMSHLLSCSCALAWFFQPFLTDLVHHVAALAKKKKKKRSLPGSSMCCHQGRTLLSSLYHIKSVICIVICRMNGAAPSHTTWTLPSFRLRFQEPQISSLFPVPKGMDGLNKPYGLDSPSGEASGPFFPSPSLNSTICPFTSLGYKY